MLFSINNRKNSPLRSSQSSSDRVNSSPPSSLLQKGTPVHRNGNQCVCGGGCPRCSGSLPSIVQNGLSTPSRALPAPQRRGLEQQFRRDLSSLRMHVGPAAEQSADQLASRAYTVGAHS